MPRQFFPASDRPELTVDMTLRQNASIYATEAQAKRLETLLKDDPDVDHFSTYVGRGAIRFILTLNVQLANPFFAQFVIVAKDLEARERLQPKLEKVLAEQFPDVVARVSPLELGPPVGWPLQYRVTGPDKDEVRRIALEFAEVLGSDPRTRHVNFDWMEPARQLRVNVDQDEARRLGVSSRGAGRRAQRRGHRHRPSPRCATTSTSSTWSRARPTSERASFEALSSLQVPTPSGRMVPLRQFATFVEEQEFPLVWRRDRVPTLTVRADVAGGVLPDAVVGALAPKIAEFATKLPKQYKVATGGLYEESAISSASVFAVVPLMIVLMLATMMCMLVSFRRLAMVVALLPLGLIGVVLALLRVQPAAGLRRDPRHPGADRHDRQERGDPDRPDRDRPRRRQGRARRGHGVGDRAPAADDADGDLHRARPDPDRAHGVLGTDGLRHHGRTAGGDAADADPAARAVRGGVRQREDGAFGGSCLSSPRAPTSVALVRGATLFALWIVLMQSVKPLDLVVGGLAAFGATWVSLQLLPPAAGSVRFLSLLALLPHFLWQSLLAGIDVARRAFAPSLPLRPGFVEYRTGFPPRARPQHLRD